MKKDTYIRIVAQAFYGNKTGTELEIDEIDRFILGYLDDSFPVAEPIDRTIVSIPNAEELVIVYNKHQEMRRLLQKEELLRTEQYELKPLARIPELKLELYSRCIICRMNAKGELKSIEKGDAAKFMHYLAD